MKDVIILIYVAGVALFLFGQLYALVKKPELEEEMGVPLRMLLVLIWPIMLPITIYYMLKGKLS